MRIANAINRPIITALLAACVATLAACASAPPELEEARSTYADVASGPAAKLAPAELDDAKEALDLAEKSFEEEGDEPITRSLAFRAQRMVQIAGVEADIYQARRATEENRELYISRSEESRESMKSQLAEYRREIDQREAAIARNRQEIQQMESSLEDAKQAGQMTEAQLAEKRQKLEAKQEALADKEKQLAVIRTELKSERERRKELQERLETAMKKLDEFADVKEDRERMVITLSGEVLFEVGESTLRTSAKRKLDQVAEVLLAKRDANIDVLGHTDSQGKAQMNQELSKDRALSVKTYLVSQGIADDRVDAIGKGETDPVASNDTPEGRANNRRVEIVVGNESPQSASL
jgi:outer membrane protein OmpA-like peptidoglycan-associated protein